MDLQLAHISFSQHARVWRLRLDGVNGEALKSVDLLEFSGDINTSKDAEHISLILASWGVKETKGHWESRDGAWVVPVVKRHP